MACGSSSGESSDGSAGGADLRTLSAGAVTVDLPASWVDTPEEALTDVWTVGADDRAENPTSRVRIYPEPDSSPYLDSLIGVLAGQASFGRAFDGTFDQGSTSSFDVEGADTAHQMEFEFRDGEYLGRYWTMVDRSNGRLGAVELTTEKDGGLSEEEIAAIRDSLRFDSGD